MLILSAVLGSGCRKPWKIAVAIRCAQIPIAVRTTPIHCLSLAFRCRPFTAFPRPFHCLSLAFRCPFTAFPWPSAAFRSRTTRSRLPGCRSQSSVPHIQRRRRRRQRPTQCGTECVSQQLSSLNRSATAGVCLAATGTTCVIVDTVSSWAHAVCDATADEDGTKEMTCR